MSCYEKVSCPACGSHEIIRSGRSACDSHRYRCQSPVCTTQTFMLNDRYKAYEPGIKEPRVEMAINGSGIRDTARVLHISKGTVSSTLKKPRFWFSVILIFTFPKNPVRGGEVSLGRVCSEAELDEQWSYVGDQSNQRWLWLAVGHHTNTGLASVFG